MLKFKLGCYKTLAARPPQLRPCAAADSPLRRATTPANLAGASPEHQEQHCGHQPQPRPLAAPDSPRIPPPQVTPIRAIACRWCRSAHAEHPTGFAGSRRVDPHRSGARRPLPRPRPRAPVKRRLCAPPNSPPTPLRCSSGRPKPSVSTPGILTLVALVVLA